MIRIVLILIVISTLTSCLRRLKEPPSVIEAYKQYQVLIEVKKKLRKDNSGINKDELIRFGQELAPRDSELKLIEAEEFRKKGQKTKAKAAIEQAMALSPNSSQPFTAYGELLIEDGLEHQGQRYCLHAIQLNPIDLRGRKCAGK